MQRFCRCAVQKGIFLFTEAVFLLVRRLMSLVVVLGLVPRLLGYPKVAPLSDGIKSVGCFGISTLLLLQQQRCDKQIQDRGQGTRTLEAQTPSLTNVTPEKYTWWH